MTYPATRPVGLAVIAIASVWTNQAATFDDIQYWVGTGTNRAALVIDWKDAKPAEAVLWGYRWNGTATGLDMFRSVVQTDARLFAHLGSFSWGTAIFGIGYNLNHRGAFGVDPALTFDANGWLFETGGDNADDARIPTDASDHYREGWNTGFWAYYVKESTAEEWASAMTGSEGRSLTDGAWDGFTFAADFNSSAPVEPTPALANPFAVEVVAAEGPFGAAPYDDPASLLGMPSTDFYDPWGEFSGGTADRRVKLVEAAYNYRDAEQTEKLITTLDEGSSVVI